MVPTGINFPIRSFKLFYLYVYELLKNSRRPHNVHLYNLDYISCETVRVSYPIRGKGSLGIKRDETTEDNDIIMNYVML